MIPAYIKLRFDQKCLACNEVIKTGNNAFYIKEGNQVYHAKCGKPEWKVKGSPYDIRIQSAITHRMKSMSRKDKIKLALRRFRKELSIPVHQLNLDADVFIYLKQYKLIDFDDYKSSYVIVPKGFSWDVDNNCVKMPGFEEDIMARDSNVEIMVEE